VKIKNKTLLLVAVAILFFCFATPVRAQEITPTVSDDEVNRVAQQLYCPVCENTPLDVCPTKACAQWRELIREKIALGWSDQQIKQYFAEQYGGQVLAVPPLQGLNWIVYVLPPLVVIGGIYLAITIVKRSRKSVIPEETDLVPSPPPASETVMEQIEKDLQKEERS
jgi:cytochrome c-type biogenesis protein CcmH